jgi:hypothetical protein
MPSLIRGPASTTEQQWFYTRAEVDHSPSVRAGMSSSEEREMRQKAVHAIWMLKDGLDMYAHSHRTIIELLSLVRALIVDCVLLIGSKQRS